MEKRLNIKLEQLELSIQNFSQSLSIKDKDYPEIIKDSIESGRIQKFEISVELLWKAIKIYLYEIDGVETTSPKNAVKSFFNAGHCGYDEYETLIEMIDDRNACSHIYRKEMIEEISARLDNYLNIMNMALDRMKMYIKRRIGNV